MTILAELQQEIESQMLVLLKDSTVEEELFNTFLRAHVYGHFAYVLESLPPPKGYEDNLEALDMYQIFLEEKILALEELRDSLIKRAQSLAPL